MKTLLALLPIVPLFSTATIAEPYRHIDKTIHHLPDDRRVIIERVAPIQLPDPPEPVVCSAPAAQSSEQLALLAAAWRADHDANPTIHDGATVYRLPDGTTVTHVNHLRVSRLTKAQAAAWHRHANSRNGGAK